MKKVLFIIITLISVISFALSGLLLNDHGVALMFLIPLLGIGLITGIIAYFIKRTQELTLNKFSTWLHYFNLVLLVLGLITLVYTFNS